MLPKSVLTEVLDPVVRRAWQSTAPHLMVYKKAPGSIPNTRKKKSLKIFSN